MIVLAAFEGEGKREECLEEVFLFGASSLLRFNLEDFLS